MNIVNVLTVPKIIFHFRYVLDTKVDKDGNTHPVLRNISRTQSEENIVFDIGRETLTVQNIQEKITKVAGDFATAVSTTLNTITTSNPIRQTPSPYDDKSCLDSLIARSPSHDFILNIPPDPHMSPYLASDKILQQMPSVKCITVTLDPCLDDCIMFGKKLRRLGNDFEIEILDGLPHGFLNFTMVCKLTILLCLKILLIIINSLF